MGEAKYRRQFDKTFGSIPKKSQMRGLIISSPLIINGSAMSILNGSLDEQDLRFSLFFWDRLCWPSSRGIMIAGGDSSRYLEKAGILTRPEFLIDGDQGKAVLRSRMLAMEQFEKTAPGEWSIGAGTNSIIIPQEFSVENQGSLIELYQAIPIPTKDVPLADILDFRQRRRDELLAFRAHLENLSKEITGAADSVDILNSKLKEIDLACANLFKVAREWQMPVYLSDFKASINFDLNKAVGAAVNTWKASTDLGMPTTAAVAAATASAISSQFKINSDIKFQTIKRARSPYMYAYRLGQEL